MRASRVAEAGANLLLFAAVGVAPLDAARDGITSFWNEFEGEPDAHFFSWERELVTRFVRPADHVLVVGCGSGRDTIAFLEHGCRVTAIDPAPDALMRARRLLLERRLDAELACGFIENWRGAEPVDVIWFSWFTYGYIPTARRRVGALANAVAQMKPGGRVIISFQTSRPRNRAAGLARIVSRCVGNDWAVEEGDRIARVGGSAFTFEHWFTEEEFAREMQEAGLRIVGRAGPAVVAEVDR